MRVAFKNIAGVDQVAVSLNQGKADVSLKSGNSVTFAQFENALVKNGFSTKDSNVVVSGRLAFANGNWSIRVTGSNEEFALTPLSNAQPPSPELNGAEVVVTGVISVTDMKKSPAGMRFSNISREK
ncbi:MAG TPA: hypothetical protein VFO34_10780 [Candidatus Acidoferrales bacterium]|nr:hypothetical protein [Candidatus Acidoferrales bacterium]